MLRRSGIGIVLVSAVIGLMAAACGGGGGTTAAGPGWGAAATVSTNIAGNTGSARVAMDNTGNAVAVWLQSDGGFNQVWASRYSAGAGWGPANFLDNNQSGDADSAQVAAGDNGDAVAVWMQSDGMRNNIWASRYAAGTARWDGAPAILTDNNGLNADFPHVAMDNGGNAVAVWKQDNGVVWKIWANRYAAGSGWGTPFAISTNSAGNADNPRAAMDRAGNTLVVWNQDDGGGRQNIWSNRHIAGTGWDPVPRIVSDNTGDASIPRLAMNGDGKAVVVWEQSDGVLTHIWGNRYAPAGWWGAAAAVETDNTVSSGRANVGVDAAGNAIAVWEQSDGTRSNIWGTRGVAGGGWGAATLIETDNAGSAGNPQVAMDTAGNATAAWEQSDGTTTSIRANRYVPGFGWGTAVHISAGTGDAGGPRVAVGSGRAVVVWEQIGATWIRVWGNVYR